MSDPNKAMATAPAAPRTALMRAMVGAALADAERALTLFLRHFSSLFNQIPASNGHKPL